MLIVMLIRKHVLYIFYVLIGLFLLTTISNAQSSRLYTMQDGLAGSNIKSLYQDNYGFIWITSTDGLSRFDGKNFVTLKRNSNSDYSLRNNSVLEFFEDSQNNCWIGTKDGLHNFSRTENKFKHIPLLEKEDHNEMVSVSQILEDPYDKNYLLIGTSGYGAFRINKTDNNKDEHWAAKILAFAGGYIDCMTIDKTGNLWISNNSAGIVKIDLKYSEKRDVILENLNAEELLDLNNLEILVLDNNNIVFGGLNGMFLYEADKNILRRFNNKELKSLFCTSLCQQSDSILLAGTENMGLWRINLNDESAEIWEIPNCPIELNYSKIRTIMYDDQNNLWLGIFQKGLLTIPVANNDFEYCAITDKGSDKNLSCNTTFQEDLDGNLWVGSDGGGVFVYEKSSDVLIKRFNINNSSLESNAIMSIKRDNRGVMWIATYGRGIYCYENNKLTKKKELNNLNNRVMAIEYDKKRDFIYAGTNGSGVWIYDINKCKLYKLNNTDNSWIKSLYLDMQGNLWISSAVTTYCMNIEQEKHIDLNIEEIRYKMTNSFTEDNEYMWFGTTEGLWCFDKANNVMKEFRMEDSDNIPNIQSLFSFESNLWFATSESISKFERKTGKFYNYKTYEVERIGSFRSNSLGLLNNNVLLFGGDNGVLKVNCENFNIRSQLDRSVYLTGLVVQNHKTDYIPSDSKNNIIDASLWCAKNINLPFNNNSFVIEFSALEYTNPMKVKYAYKLDGYDKDWYYMNATAPRANYTNVDPGKYTFTVKAFFDEKVEDDSFKSIIINIDNPWYLTTVAKMCYLLIVMLLSYFAHLYFQSKRIRENKLREIRQTERIKEAKLKLFTSISHEIRTPLTLIISPLKKLMERENDENSKNTYELMYRNSMRILLMANQLMDIRKIDNGQLKLHFKEIDVIEVLKNVMLHFNNVAEIKNIDFKLDNENLNSLFLWADPVHFDKIFFNLLSNAFKFTPDAGQINLKINLKYNSNCFFDNNIIKEYVEIRIFNEGSLIPQNELESIFERFFQGNSKDESGSGIGLDLAKQLTLLHHGKIEVRNVENRGVEFSIYIPLGNEFLSPDELLSDKITTSINDSIETSELFDVLKTQYVSSLCASDINDLDNNDKKNKYSILFVDDDEELCRYIKNELPDFNITTSNSGNNAYKKLLTNKFDVVVTDLRMPDGDGYDLCKKIKSNPDSDHIPVIVLTSETNESSEELAMNCQADRFLEKPVNLSLLRGAIAQSLRIRENIVNKINRNDITYDYDHIKVDSVDKKLLKRVTEVISDNIENSVFSVEDLSREVGISRVHLNRKLKEIIGISPSSLIKVVRLKQAAYLLVNNKITISEVAYKVGFSSNSYFTNNFKSYFAMTPKEFINNYSKNPENEVFQKIFER